jgi:4,5-dihydroxyphthalate decarboxylase
MANTAEIGQRPLPFQDGDTTRTPWAPSFRSGGVNQPKLVLSLAISDYDHIRDLVEGRVSVEGAELLHLKLSIEEIFFRFTKSREWDVSEMSMGKFAALTAQGDRSLVGIPVFPSRVFRHSSIYVRRGGKIKVPADLRGARIGLPEWAQTAAIYSRGFLVHQFGVELEQVDWVQAGVNEPGRREDVSLELPSNIRLTTRPDASLSQLLLNGEIDAVISAHAPHVFEEGNPEIVRLFENYRVVEEAYLAESGVFPIMHTIVVRSEIVERFPWITRNLFTAFEEAKRRSVSRLSEMTASRYPIPWIQDVTAQACSLFGDDFWPYGIDGNRRTLETFLRYAHEQGVCRRLVAVEEMFPAHSVGTFKI